ncbi:MAG: universal stress protein, partial [Dinghuibacter sp.]|nr:universal stress protein [Dinghuibacter sp.]
LQEAECPVVVAPERFEQLDEIVFAYDGSATALYAIKQFAHLFPQLRQVPLTVIHVQQHGEWKTDETNKHRLHEWLQVHFEQPDFEVLSGKPGNALFDYLLNKKNILLVMGAYGRNMISQLFKRSNAAPLLDTLFHPVFIAHP